MTPLLLYACQWQACRADLHAHSLSSYLLSTNEGAIGHGAGHATLGEVLIFTLTAVKVFDGATVMQIEAVAARAGFSWLVSNVTG